MKAIIIKKVAKYLLATVSEGISYTPEGESQFRATYQKLITRELPDFTVFSDAGFASCKLTFRSTSGSVCYYRSVPIVWRSSKQGVRAYSTAEAEYIGASDTIVLTESNNFMSFFKPFPTNIQESKFGLTSEQEDSVIWVDNTSAVATVKVQDLRPKSRHYGLHYHRVRDVAEKICFCPTNFMKADPLTKLECGVAATRLLLHRSNDHTDEINDDYEESDGEEDVNRCYCLYVY